MNKRFYHHIRMNRNPLRFTFSKSPYGFTLIELLLVLFVLSIMLASAPPIIHSLQQKVEEKSFLQQLEEDLFFAQSLAITRNEAVFFNHYFHQQSYSIRSMNGDVILTRKLPSHVTILQGHMSSFWFTSTGSINKFGHMYIQTNNKVYRLFFSIGKGRFEIYEEENWLSTK